MKNLKAPFLVIALLLLNVSLVVANEPLPEPGNTDGMNQKSSEDCAACPEGFPIDQNVNILLVGGLALGAIMIYKNRTKKASI
ncbi:MULTISPECIES: hypothetical protein [Flavobacterium]|uniref:Uncharacterized protein n=1 Tax=Flavobacterium anhuiense TaxID=459526 RepID=A0AAC9D231_9FLAO|nr:MULTISPECIES: hypothetical protein [Flavobacterium]AOC95022.1 hypothetical protein BB050_01897 [Flavobacterium anhuiense]MXO06462.1 hypothetical protein [Flavobacterium sp. HBTb2-11-1]SCY94610.1 hypothetical protein SAMN02927916_4225 [Flavobacterium anhuiense]